MTIPQHDVVIVGAGVTGIYQLYRLLEIGKDVIVLEASSDVGGTWFQNRYPGARFDSESFTYGYSFSEEILTEWDWSELFAARPETLRYLNYVVDKFDLRKRMQFDCKVVSAQFDADSVCWIVTLADGRTLTTRFLLTAIGMLSAPSVPRIEGMEDFEGVSFHTYHWPHEGLDLAGKKVAVIGTGATGVQVISSIAEEVEELHVFQRRPNWCAPLHNRPIDKDEMQAIKGSYPEIFERCRQSPSGFIHTPDSRKTFEVSEEERLEFWEFLYASSGFGVWLGNFRDVLKTPEANSAFSAFVADKIRARVHDSATAEKLIPRDHGFGTRRVPLETNYYEVYNRNNVHLVDIGENPIVKITAKGIETQDHADEFDIIIYATGFDAVIGSFDRIEFTGLEGRSLKDKWIDDPTTLAGIATNGFPNLIFLAGPQGGSVSQNFPRAIEETVDWVSGLLEHLWSHDYIYVEAKTEGEKEWWAHMDEMSRKLLQTQTKSWFTGFNSNIEGRDKFRHLIYTGGAVRYREWLAAIKAGGYGSFTFRDRQGQLGPTDAATSSATEVTCS